MRKILIAALAATLAPCAFAQYILDDGTAENSVGLNNGTGLSVVWTNSFVALAGSNVITSIDLMIGANQALNQNLTIFLCADNNLDGVGDVGGLLTSMSGNNLTAGAFQNYNITDTALTVGQGFVVGAFVTLSSATNSWFPAAIDETDPDVTGRSWIGFDAAAINANNLAAIPAGQRGFIEGFGLPGNWMVRANGSAVPEPATMAALGLGVAALIRRRRAK